MKRSALFLVMILVLSNLLTGCGGNSVKPSETTAPDDQVTSSGQKDAEGTTEDISQLDTEGTAEEQKWKPEGPLLRCEQGDMIYIPNEGPVIMEKLSDDQKALVESLKTGDIIRVTIEVVEESYPGHCYPENVEFVRNGDYKPVIPVINDLKSLGWNILLSVPSLEEVADSHFSPVKEQLSYFTIDEIRASWGEPESTLSPGLGWSVDFYRIGHGEDQMSVDVQYDGEGRIIGGYTYRTADSPTIW